MSNNEKENLEDAGGPAQSTPLPKAPGTQSNTSLGGEATKEGSAAGRSSSDGPPATLTLSSPSNKEGEGEDDAAAILAEACAMLATGSTGVHGIGNQRLVTAILLWKQTLGPRVDFAKRLWGLAKNAFSATDGSPLGGKLNKNTSKKYTKIKCQALWYVLCAELTKVRQKADKSSQHALAHGKAFKLQTDPNGAEAYEPTDAALRNVINATEVTHGKSQADSDAEKARARRIIKNRAETQQLFLHFMLYDDTYADSHVQAHIRGILNNTNDQDVENLGRPGRDRTSAYAVVESLAKRAPEGDATFRLIKAAVMAPRTQGSSFPAHARKTVDQYVKANIAQHPKWGCDPNGKFAEEGSIKVPQDSEDRGLTAHVCMCQIQNQGTPTEKQQFDRVLDKAMRAAGLNERSHITWSVLLQLVHHLEDRDGANGALADENWPQWTDSHDQILKQAAAEHIAAAKAIDETHGQASIFLAATSEAKRSHEAPEWLLKTGLPFKFGEAAGKMGKEKVQGLVTQHLRLYTRQKKGADPEDESNCGFCTKFGPSARKHRLVQCKNMKKIKDILVGNNPTNRGRGLGRDRGKARGDRGGGRTDRRGRDRGPPRREHRPGRRERKQHYDGNQGGVQRQVHPDDYSSEHTESDEPNRQRPRQRPRDVREGLGRRRDGDGPRPREDQGSRRKHRKTVHGRIADRPSNAYANGSSSYAALDDHDKAEAEQVKSLFD